MENEQEVASPATEVKEAVSPEVKVEAVPEPVAPVAPVTEQVITAVVEASAVIESPVAVAEPVAPVVESVVETVEPVMETGPEETRKGRLSSEVTSIPEMRKIWAARREHGLSYSKIEEKFGLRDANGMTAYRIVEKFTSHLRSEGHKIPHKVKKARKSKSVKA